MTINTTLLGLSSAPLLTSSNYGMLAETERLTDPLEMRRLSAHGDGFLGGGGFSNPLAAIYPNGGVPQDTATLARVVEAARLENSLLGGTVPVWVQSAAGSAMPRLNTLSAIPAGIEELYETMTEVDHWTEWMPRFKKSKGIPAEHPGAITHEVLMNGGPSDFHYQSRMEYGPIEGGFQIRWRLQQLPGFQSDRHAKGLKINDGSWTFTPLPGRPNETLMAYQIHVEPQVNGLLLRTLKPIIMALTLGEFDKVISAMANRAADNSWPLNGSGNPSGRKYVVRKTG